VKTRRILAQLVRADLMGRTRRYSFLITLGVMLYAGYALVPAVDSGALTVNLGNLRGIYNSAWIGSTIALLGSMLLSLPGFYLVKNGIALDRETGVGQIIATTPLRKTTYILGKAAGNFILLIVITALVVVSASAVQFIRGEAPHLDVWDLLAPFLFTTLPTLALVAAVAVLFESLPFLRGSLGNVTYFALYIVTVIISLSGATFSEQGVIDQPINDLFGVTVIGASMLQAAHTAFPGRILDFGIGYTVVKGPIQTFCWEGVMWTGDVILGRLLWVGVALAIALLAALFFDRFDPARSRSGKGQPGSANPGRSKLDLSRFDPRRFVTLPRLSLPSFWPKVLFLRVLEAELRLTLKGLRWWWYLVALGLIAAGLSTPDVRGSLLVAWIWPVWVWSKLGVREKQHHTGSWVFAAPHPLRRQFPAAWLAGVIVTMLAGSGVGLRLVLTGEWAYFLGWSVAAFFVPTLALALGVWSGSNKFFEALYVAWWYIGPVSGLAALDFTNLSPDAIAQGSLTTYLGAIAVLLSLAALGRTRQMRLP
jgi:hypothetical protein